MTDLEKWRSLLTECGVGFTESITSENDRHPGCPRLEMAEGSEKVSGYFDFVTHVVFDKAGKFIEIGAWE